MAFVDLLLLVLKIAVLAALGYTAFVIVVLTVVFLAAWLLHSVL